MALISVTLALFTSLPVVVRGEESTTGGNTAYGLMDLYQHALERAETIQITEESVYITGLLKTKARAVLVPRITAFGDHTRYDEKKEFMGSVMLPESTTNYGVRLDQSFTLNGKEIIAFQAAKDMIEKSEQDLNTVKETYLFQVAAAYYDLLRARKAENIAIANEKRLSAHRDAVIMRLKLEEVPKTDLFRAEAELSSARAELVKAVNTIALARAVLARVAFLEPGFQVIEPDREEVRIAEYQLEALKQAAVKNRSEIKAQRFSEEIAEKQIRFTKGDFWPRISVEAMYLNSEQDPASPIDDTDTFSVGLKLEYPLFDGGLRRANVSEERARKRQVDLQTQDLIKQIHIEVEEAYLAVASLKGVLDALDDQFSFAKENIEAVTLQYRNGLADILDVLDANTLLVNSETQLAEALYRLQQAGLLLDRVRGTFLTGILEKVDTTK
ncbi:MAG: TolC family protein [Desulfobacteraceae bacterium]|nr:TolC family protein [Desulfobacteraceae bacterium]